MPTSGRRRFPAKIARPLLLGLVGLSLSGCSPFFVLRAGYEEAKILSRRQSIARLVESPNVDPARRAKLSLVLDVRGYAEEVLGLEAGNSYTTFSQLDSDTLALVLSAARKDRFEPYTWWFPIIGRVPYRAFFSEEGAAEAVARLEANGLDAYVRPTSAFSTLGWFADPLVSPLLRYDSISLANTVVHELLHNTIYLSGQAIFNESFANFVGARGAIEYFCLVRADPQLCANARAAWRDEILFGAYLTDVVDELDALYSREDLDYDRKLAAREEVFARARARFENEVRPGLTVLSFGSFAREPLNNAYLISRRIYYRDLDVFERVYLHTRGELRQTIERIQEAAEAGRDDPLAAVDALLANDGAD